MSLAGKAILFNTSLKHASINFFTFFAGLFSAQHLPCFGVDVYFSTFAKHSSYRINENRLHLHGLSINFTLTVPSSLPAGMKSPWQMMTCLLN